MQRELAEQRYDIEEGKGEIFTDRFETLIGKGDGKLCEATGILNLLELTMMRMLSSFLTMPTKALK